MKIKQNYIRLTKYEKTQKNFIEIFYLFSMNVYRKYSNLLLGYPTLTIYEKIKLHNYYTKSFQIDSVTFFSQVCLKIFIQGIKERNA